MQSIAQHDQSFTYGKRFKRVFIWIFLFHLIFGLISYFGLPKFDFKKRADLVIELSALPPSSGGKQSTSNQSSSQTKESTRKDVSLDKVGGDIPKTANLNQWLPPITRQVRPMCSQVMLISRPHT